MTDTTGVTSWEYDALDRPITITWPASGTVGYRYDGVGNRTQVVYPGGVVVTYTYDAADRLVTVQDWDGGVTTHGYDGAGRPLTVSLPNGIETTYDYDTAGRLTEIEHRDSSDSQLARYGYELDGVGNRVAVSETLLSPIEGMSAAVPEPVAYLAQASAGRDLPSPASSSRAPGLAAVAPPRSRDESEMPGLFSLPTQQLSVLPTLSFTSTGQEGPGPSRYHVTWQEPTHLPDLAGAYQALNPAHNVRTYFTPDGIRIIRQIGASPSWEMGLQFVGYGYGHVRYAAAEAVAVDDSRIAFDRGSITEWYVNGEHGLEQGFTLDSAPYGRHDGDLVIELALAGNLSASVADAGDALEFSTSDSVHVLRYGDLRAYDAAGRELLSRIEPVFGLSRTGEGAILTETLPLTASATAALAEPIIGETEGSALIEGIRLLVDDAAAVYPITVDPLITSPVTFTAQLVLQPGPMDGVDTYIDQAYPNASYGDDPICRIGKRNGTYYPGGAYRSLLRFYLSALPAGAVITAAKLEVYALNYDYTPNTFRFYRATSDWDEDTTWNTQPTYDSSTLWASFLSSTPYRTFVKKTVDVTDLVSAWHDGTYPNYGFYIRGSSEAYWTRHWIASSEKSIESQRPRLIIDYVLPPVVSTRTITYTYDSLSRLVSADYSSDETFTYAYDAVGNRLTMTQQFTTTVFTTSYAYDAANRLTSVDDTTYTWDERGNLIYDGTFAYTYNSAGRMVRVEDLGSTLVYTYNADGLRVQELWSADAGRYKKAFTWDLASPLAQVLATSDGARYVHGLDLVAERRSGAWAYPLGDALGSVRQWTDEDGYVNYAGGYTPFGVGLWSEGSTESAWGFTGEWWDAYMNQGMLYLRARWYEPYLNRFTSPDPIIPDYRNPQSINRYVYVQSNPVNYTDPSGLFTIGCRPETRNLTDWLVREMYHQSNSWPVQQGLSGMGIAPFNEMGNTLLNDAWSGSDVWLRALANQVLGLPGLGLNTQQQAELIQMQQEAATGMLLRGTAGLWWANMVKDGARWDFKDALITPPRGPGESIMLCGIDGCDWYEYSMPGNIFFSYVGRVAGFSEFEIRAGAIYAQQTDRENVWWLNTWYGLDQATDVAALELGFELYNLTGGTASEDFLRMHFKYLMRMYRGRLAQADEPTEPYFTSFPIGLDGPEFPLRYFDGQNCLGFFGGW